MSHYSHFSLLGYAERQQPHGRLTHAYRIVNPVAAVREHYSGVSSSGKFSIDYNQSSDSTTFRNFLRQHPTAFVWFHATWCGHCVAMKDEYEQAAKQLGEEVSFVKIDVDQHQPLAKFYNVQGFPTLKLFKNGNDTETFEGKRSAKSFVDWLQQRI